MPDTKDSSVQTEKHSTGNTTQQGHWTQYVILLEVKTKKQIRDHCGRASNPSVIWKGFHNPNIIPKE